MANILDYIRELGNNTFQKVKLNEIDNLIFSRLSYLPFESIKLEEKETFESIYKKMNSVNINEYNMKQDKELIELVGTCNRYKNLIVTDYYFSRDERKKNNLWQLQFI